MAILKIKNLDNGVKTGLRIEHNAKFKYEHCSSKCLKHIVCHHFFKFCKPVVIILTTFYSCPLLTTPRLGGVSLRCLVLGLPPPSALLSTLPSLPAWLLATVHGFQQIRDLLMHVLADMQGNHRWCALKYHLSSRLLSCNRNLK